ncbi:MULTISPECIES: hypothetical protein [Flavobacterium]|uniref:hypothetical protein n=1 Tax=Flavobacterium TaxID=237 RepID=UPI0021140F98|nr:MULTISPECIES: hypothetical protein [Flavobacterium]UUF13243.1 hypothetical protein NLJ00_18445 [Flavobacterium panici]
MGFFKKIGQAIKKNVSFKNVVKLATTAVGFVPGVGGVAQQVIGKVTDAVEAKKQAKRAEAEGKQAEADYWNAQTKALEQNAGATVGAVAGSATGVFADAVLQGAYGGTSKSVKEGVANVGADMADMTITAWFKKHWKHILIGVGVIGVVILIKKQIDRSRWSRQMKKPRPGFQSQGYARR